MNWLLNPLKKNSLDRSCSNVELKGPSRSVNLLMPASHPLKEYLIKYRCYDRYLPRLAAVCSGVIVDIGANIGDSALHIASFCSNKIICAEPDSTFVELMNKNIVNNGLGDQISVYPCAISCQKDMRGLVKSGTQSTSRLVQHAASSSMASVDIRTMSDLLECYSLSVCDLGLVKIDTDSQDWDCINSLIFALESVTFKAPILYFELCPMNPYTAFSFQDALELKGEYMHSINSLVAVGFDYFQVFDNFGLPILSTADVREIASLIDYLHLSIAQGRAPFHYFDIACGRSCDGHPDLIEAALRGMLRDIAS